MQADSAGSRKTPVYASESIREQMMHDFASEMFVGTFSAAHIWRRFILFVCFFFQINSIRFGPNGNEMMERHKERPLRTEDSG